MHCTTYFFQHIARLSPPLKIGFGLSLAYLAYLSKEHYRMNTERRNKESDVTLYQTALRDYGLDEVSFRSAEIMPGSGSVITSVFDALLKEYPTAPPKRQLLMLAFFYQYHEKITDTKIKAGLKKLAPKEFFQTAHTEDPYCGDIYTPKFPGWFERTLRDYVSEGQISEGSKLDDYVAINKRVRQNQIFIHRCGDFYTRLVTHYLDQLHALRSSASWWDSAQGAARKQTSIATIEKKLLALVTPTSAKELVDSLDVKNAKSRWQDSDAPEAVKAFYQKVMREAPWLIQKIKDTVESTLEPTVRAGSPGKR
jgi:hypothetical protein